MDCDICISGEVLYNGFVYASAIIIVLFGVLVLILRRRISNNRGNLNPNIGGRGSWEKILEIHQRKILQNLAILFVFIGFSGGILKGIEGIDFLKNSLFLSPLLLLNVIIVFWVLLELYVLEAERKEILKLSGFEANMEHLESTLYENRRYRKVIGLSLRVMVLPSVFIYVIFIILKLASLLSIT